MTLMNSSSIALYNSLRASRMFYEFLFLLDIFFIYISNVIPFPGFPSENPLLLDPPPPAQQPTFFSEMVGIRVS